MKILAVADIHGCLYKLEELRHTADVLKPDLMVIAGDISNYVRPRKSIQALSNMPVPVLAVRGNSDLLGVKRLLSDSPLIKDLHLKRLSFNGTPFVGIGGTIPFPFRSRICLKESSQLAKIKPLVDQQTIVVSHTPPFRILDCMAKRFPVGSRGLRQFVLSCKPRMLICGHIHECMGSQYEGDTVVVNCSIGNGGKGALIELIPNKAPRVRFI